MSTSNATGRQGGPLHPQTLRLEDLARILSVSGSRPVTVEMLQADVDAGAPTNPDGTMSLVEYARWLITEMSHGRD